MAAGTKPAPQKAAGRRQGGRSDAAPERRKAGAPEAAVFSGTGEPAGEVRLSESVFGETPNPAVMHQAVLRQLANARQGTAATKTRAMVSGGGAKPYRQKGTGRARHGSEREPSMVGGGTVFGPQPRSYRQEMPRRMRRLALRSALSVKAGEGKVSVLESFELEEPKTRVMVELLRKIGVDQTALVVLAAPDMVVARSVANLPWAKAVLASNLSLYDLFTHDRIVFARDALDRLEQIFAAGPRQKDVEGQEAAPPPTRRKRAGQSATGGGEKATVEETEA